MMQEMFEFLQEIVTWLEIGTYGITLAWFIGKVYCDISVRKIGQIITFLAYLSFYMFRFWIWEVPGWINYIWIYGLLCLFLYKGQSFQSVSAKNTPIIKGRISPTKKKYKLLVFLLVTWYCVQNICILIEGSLFNFVSDFLVLYLESIEVFFLQLAITYLLGTIFRIGMVIFMIVMLVKRIGNTFDNFSGKEVIALLLMPMAGVLFGNMVVRLLFVVKEEIYFSLYEEFPYFHLLVPIVGLLFYFGILFSVSAYHSMLALQEEKKKNFVHEQKNIALKNRMKEMMEFFDTTRRTRHDMRNHVMALKGLLERDAVAEAKAYLCKIDASIGTFHFHIQTGNSVTDVLVNDYYKKAKELGIAFQSSFYMEESITIDVFDMAIVLGNLLENALEACVHQLKENKNKMPVIQIAGRQKNKFYLLKVKNTFEGNVLLDEETGLPVSTKSESAFHGLGLENVSRIAEKYLGTMDISIKEQQFCVMVLFHLKS